MLPLINKVVNLLRIAYDLFMQCQKELELLIFTYFQEQTPKRFEQLIGHLSANALFRTFFFRIELTKTPRNIVFSLFVPGLYKNCIGFIKFN